jgi:hypothetical protein
MNNRVHGCRGGAGRIPLLGRTTIRGSHGVRLFEGPILKIDVTRVITDASLNRRSRKQRTNGRQEFWVPMLKIKPCQSEVPPTKNREILPR